MNIATLNAMLTALGYAPAVPASIAATKATPAKASKALVMPVKTSKATKAVAPVEKGTISDEDLLAHILKLADDGIAKSAFNVMIGLRKQNISSSRKRINRVIEAWKAEQDALNAAKAAKSAARKAKRA